MVGVNYGQSVRGCLLDDQFAMDRGEGIGHHNHAAARLPPDRCQGPLDLRVVTNGGCDRFDCDRAGDRVERTEEKRSPIRGGLRVEQDRYVNDSPEMMENQPELLAQHFAQAGLVEKSVAYWGKAGHRSAARSAMAEAAAQFRKGLDQLVLLPNNRERQQQELEFYSALG